MRVYFSSQHDRVAHLSFIRLVQHLMKAALLRLGSDVLAGTRDKKPPIVKKRKDKGALAPSKIVLVDGGDPKVRTQLQEAAAASGLRSAAYRAPGTPLAL